MAYSKTYNFQGPIPFSTTLQVLEKLILFSRTFEEVWPRCIREVTAGLNLVSF